MNDQKDRIAIIGAIQDASARELKALAEIKNAISSHGAAPEDKNAPQGRVSRRLSRAPKQSVPPRERIVPSKNPYVDRLPRRKKNNIRLTSSNKSALNRRRKTESLAQEDHSTLSDKKTDRINITVNPAPSKGINLAASARMPDPGSKTDTAPQPATQRDSKGRFQSKGKNEELLRQKSQKEEHRADARLQAGFFRRLGSFTGMDAGSGNANGDAVTDAAGIAAGGPVWMVARGAFDVAKEVKGKITTLSEWAKGQQDDNTDSKNDEPTPQPHIKQDAQPGVKPVISYPSAEARNISAPEMGKPRSTATFAESQTAKSVQVVQEQTDKLASNDERIIDVLEDVEDEIIKLRKTIKKSDGFKLSDLFRGKLPGFGRNRGRYRGRNSRTGGGRDSRSSRRDKSAKHKRTSTAPGSTSSHDQGRYDGPDKGKKPKPSKNKAPGTKSGKTPGKGKWFGKLAGVFSSTGAKLAGGAAATAGTVTAGSALSDKVTGAASQPAEHTTKAASQKATKATASAQKTAQTATEGVQKATTQTTAKVGTKAAESVAEKSVATAAESTAAKTVAATVEKTTEKAATKVALEGGEKAAGVVAAKGAMAAGGKLAAKTALRAVPLVGSAAMALYDGVDGYNDTEAQKAAFSLKEGEEVSAGQKASYAAANVVDMGGLLSGGANLLGKGISALGFDSAGESLQNFDTGTIARGISGVVDDVKSVAAEAASVTGSVVDKAKSFLTADNDNSGQVKKAVEDGTKKTVDAINALKAQLQGGVEGEDGVGLYGNASPKEFTAPQANNIATDLNIGGKNAKNRNFRNNNLGNLNFAGQEGASLEAANAKGERRFAKFNTPEEGIRALGNQVLSYYNGTSKAAGNQKLQTVSAIIAKWAPPDENNTNQYIKNVCDYLGVSPSEKIDVTNPEVMTRLVRAIATKEGGNPTVNDDFIKNALGSVNTDTGRWEGQFSDESLSKINEARTAKGEAAIARDSQYSAGSKVKLANGSAPATPVKSSVPLKTPANPEPEVIQRAQATKKPTSVTPPPATAMGKSTAAIAPHPGPATSAALKSSSEAVKAASFTSNPSQDAGAMAENDAALTGENPEQGGAGSFVAQYVAAMTKSAMDFVTSGGGGGFDERTRQADQSLSAALQKATGKSFGFRKAAPLAAVQKASRTENSSGAATKTIDLLESKGKTTDAVNAREHGIPIDDNGKRSVKEDDKGVLDSLLDSSVSGLKSLGSAVLPSLGESVSGLVGGISGGSLVSDLVSQLTGGNSDITRAVSPLTQKAGKWLDGGIQQAAGGINSLAGQANDAIFGARGKQEPYFAMTPVQNPPADQARSSIHPPGMTEGEDKGFLGSLLDSSVNGLKSLGAAVLPSLGESVSGLVGGVSGGSLVSDLVSQLTGGNSDIARAVSPLTQKAGEWLDGGIQQAAGGINNMAGQANDAIFGARGKQEPYLAMPPQLNTVTDLARSGIRQPLTSDNANHDPAMLKALDNVYGVLKEMLGVSKTANKGDPDKVVSSAQPQPRPRTNTSVSDPSLDTLLED